MALAGIYVWHIQNLVPEDSKPGAKSRKSTKNIETVKSDSTVSAATIASNVQRAESEIFSQLASAKRVPTPPNQWKS